MARFVNLQPSDLAGPLELARAWCAARDDGLVKSNSAELVAFFGAAEHALRVGRNPPALFADLVRRRAWGVLTDADEERGRRQLARAARCRPRGAVALLVAALADRWAAPTEPSPEQIARLRRNHATEAYALERAQRGAQRVGHAV